MGKSLLVALVWCLATFGLAQSQTKPHSESMLPKLIEDDGDDFIVIAHRGASAYFPENTMAAFRGAVQMRAEMIELDILLSSDGVPVVFHDATLEDHTDGEGPVDQYTLEELQQLDAGSWYSSEYAGEQIPTLEEVIAFASGKIALNIEIKSEAVTDHAEGGVEEKALALVEKYDMKQHVLFSSFDYRALRHLKQLAPEVPVALLYNPGKSGKKLPSELVAEYGADAFNCSHSQLNRKRGKDLRTHDIPVFIYTVNQKRRMKNLIGWGVKGIFSNKPDLLRSVARQQHSD